MDKNLASWESAREVNTIGADAPKTTPAALTPPNRVNNL
jgi:hypothetical protein